MVHKHIILLVILVTVHNSLQGINNNQVDDDVNPLAEAAAAILKEQNAENIGGIVNNIMQSGGAKQLGDMLMNAASSENAGQILQGLGSLIGNQGGGGGGGLDPSVLGTVMNLIQSSSNSKSGGSGFDMGSMFSLMGSFMGSPDSSDKKSPQGIMDYMPMVLQTVNSFVGPEAQARADSHSDHAWLLPPVIEKAHLLFDHFIHSDLGKQLLNIIGAEKFVKIFTDENGRLSYDKFVDMMENHSFRRHWIRMVTNRIAWVVSYAADPQIQKQYFFAIQAFVNSLLKTQGFPKTALLDMNRPIESISAFTNHLAKATFDIQINARQYVKPIVEYAQDLIKLAQKKGILIGSGVDTRALSDKLADTINLEIIEPIARVNRAYRFAKKVPECDRYVMCLVNQETPDLSSSIPGIRPLLSKSASLVLSWFLSSHTGTSFWTLYHVIVEETNCQPRYVKACHDFHLEEVKVTTEYVHNEL